ncbi:hypothetical protein WJX72_006951 [[Myrmecia] bisecta]|uniref:Fatty acid hydroxylase domain-containing protein n=1 Tax=[Myrmecia] bisecta TaxID=41462 RepID=A0AAW1QRA6_9CHLO
MTRLIGWARLLLLLCSASCVPHSSQHSVPAVVGNTACLTVLGAQQGENSTCRPAPQPALLEPAELAKGVPGVVKSRSQHIAEVREENDWKNDLILAFLPVQLREQMPRIVRAWLRNYVACVALYHIAGGLWAYYIYLCFGKQLFPDDKMPSRGDMLEQIKVAHMAMPLYAMLPSVTEWAIERGWTLVYTRIDDVGLPRHLLYFALYMTSVEFFVYWMHRLLHDVKIGYRWLHHIHHKYNKEHTLSPFAGLAFHPLDGILQAVPYCWTLFYMPMHFLTFELLLFATGVWTTNIHDCIHGRLAPIMGAGYHTIHHTIYRVNYGHYTTYFDKLFGTLMHPEEYPEHLQRAKQTKQQ